jgi:hypothetical protein
MKKRSYTLFTYALAVLMGVALFLTSERVQRAERVYNDIQEKLTVEREAYHILQTEWTYLNRPDRLEDLAVTHLKLAPLKPDATLTTVVNLPIAAPKSEKEKSIITAALFNTMSPASGTENVTQPVSKNIETPQQKEVAVETTSPASEIIKVSAPARAAHNTPTSATALSSTLPKKAARVNRNTSTAGVTFYQYMNRGPSRGSTGGTR